MAGGPTGSPLSGRSLVHHLPHTPTPGLFQEGPSTVVEGMRGPVLSPHPSSSAAAASAAVAAATAAAEAAAIAAQASGGHYRAGSECGSGPSLPQQREEQHWRHHGGPSPGFGGHSAASETMAYRGHSFAGSSMGPSLNATPTHGLGGRGQPMSVDIWPPPVQPLPGRQSPAGPVFRRDPGLASGLPIYDQADAAAFAELGRKAPQPRDMVVAHYPGGSPPELAYSADGFSGAVASNSSHLAEAAFGSAGYAAASPGFGAEYSQGAMLHEPMGAVQAHSSSHGWARVPLRDTPNSMGLPMHSWSHASSAGGGSLTAPVAAPMGWSRPVSAGPSSRGGRYSHGPHDGMLLPAEPSYRGPPPAGPYSARPPTWYEGSSDASLSARGLGGSHHGHSGLPPGVLLSGGDIGGGRGFGPLDRLDNFAADVMWAK